MSYEKLSIIISLIQSNVFGRDVALLHCQRRNGLNIKDEIKLLLRYKLISQPSLTSVFSILDFRRGPGVIYYYITS